MKTWTPLLIGLVLAVLTIAYPFLMGIFDEDYLVVGGFLEIILIPIAVGAFLIGIIGSLVLYFRRRATS